MSEAALQTAEKREAKGKGERERETQLNAEFQRISRRDKKAFLSEQCKEIEESNTTGKTRSFQENWQYQGKISYKDGPIKDRNGKNLTEAQAIKNRCQENTEELYKKKGLNDSDNHDRVVSRLEPDTLECQVKWALGSITTNNRTTVFTNPAFTCIESQLIARGKLGRHLRSWQVFGGVGLTSEGVMGWM